MSNACQFKKLLVGLSCGCQAELETNITDGLDLVTYDPAACSKGHAKLGLPLPIVGFGPLWGWDDNRTDRRALSSVKVAQFEPDHVYKLLEGYFFANEPGKSYPAFGPIATIRWAEPAKPVHH